MTDATPHRNKQTSQGIIAAVGFWWSLLALLYSTNFVQQFVSRLKYWPDTEVIAIMPLGFFAGLYAGPHLMFRNGLMFRNAQRSFLKTVALPLLGYFATFVVLYVFLSDRAGHWMLVSEFESPDTGAVTEDYVAIMVGYIIASGAGSGATLVKDELALNSGPTVGP